MTKKTTGRSWSTGNQPPSEVPVDHLFAESGVREPPPGPGDSVSGESTSGAPEASAETEVSRQLADAEARFLRARGGPGKLS